MPTVNRSFVVVVTCASLVASGLAAPMMHVHDDADHVSAHHHGRVIHSHREAHATAARHASPGSSLENDGAGADAARPIDLFQMVLGWWPSPAGLPPAIVSPPPPALRTVTVQLLVQHSHDPPLGKTQPSRAPPFFLS